MANKLKVCVIGCGGIATLHFRALSEISDVELTGVADINKSRVDVAARKWKAAPYTDYKEMISELKPDIVTIATPVYLHAPMAQIAAENGAHVLCEKPLARNMVEAKAIADACQRKGVMLGVFNNWRYSGIISEIKKVIDSNAIGKIHTVHTALSSIGPERIMPFIGEWIFDKEKSGGGVMLDIGFHAIDIIECLFGEIKSVSAETGKFVKPGNVEDTAAMIFRMDNGIIATLRCGWAEFVSNEETGGIVLIIGEKGSIRASIQQKTMSVTKFEKRTTTETVDLAYLMCEEPYTGHKAKIQEFIDMVKSKKDAGAALKKALETQAVVEAAYQAAASGMRMDISTVVKM